MNSPQIPERLQVGPYSYRVITDATSFMQQRMNQNQPNLVGLHKGKTGEIYLDPERPAAFIAETLLHEVMHAIWMTAGDVQENITDEVAIGILTPLLLDTLRRNPDLVRFLLEDGE